MGPALLAGGRMSTSTDFAGIQFHADAVTAAKTAAAEKALADTDAPWPAPTPLPEGLPEVPAFDLELLPDALRARVEDVGERLQCPPDFPAVALVISLASIIGTRCKIAPKRYDDWTVTPNLWGMVIGRPGVMKSPALQEIMKPLQGLQARAHEAYQAELLEHKAGKVLADVDTKVRKGEIEKLLKQKQPDRERAEQLARGIVKDDDSQPVCRRYLVNDSTVEKLGELLNQNPTGLLMFRDELAGFFRTLERAGHEGDRSFYLECWNGDGAFTYDRIGRGTLHIANTCLSLLGSIQPGPVSDLVRELRGSGDDGMLQRFQLAVWPDTGQHWSNVDRRPNVAARQAVEDIITRLDQMLPSNPVITRFDDEAQPMFDTWRGALEQRLRQIEQPVLEAHLSKYRSLVPSLALILHLAESTSSQVSMMSLVRAIAWAEYLEPHAKRIYAPAMAPDLDAARLLARRIQSGEVPRTFTLRDIYRNHWSGLSTREAAAAAAAVLDDYDWLRTRQVRGTGRPKTEYTVNPLLTMGAP